MDRVFKKRTGPKEVGVLPPLTVVVAVDGEKLVVAEHDRHETAERRVICERFEHRQYGRVPEDEPDAGLYPSPVHSGNHLLDVNQGRGEWLLAEDVLTMLSGAEDDLFVTGRRNANINDAYVL